MTSRPQLYRTTRFFAVTAAILGLAASSLVVAGPAVAAGETLSVTVSQTTGTSVFDGDDAAGHDSSATNDIIRTNDTITYSVGIRYEGGDQTAPHLTFSLPQGEGLVSLPPFCLAGSTLTPATLPDPVVPTTATSWTALPAQAIDCLVAPQNQGTSLNYDFLSKVRPEVPNGTVLGPVTVSATSDQVTTPATSEPVQHTVSAAADFDVSKRLASTSDTDGPFFQYYSACSFDSTRSCVVMDFPLTVNAPSGGKGVTPLASPITITDDLSPDAFFGPGTTTSAAWIGAGSDALDKYAPRLAFCNGGVANLHGPLPNPSGGSETNLNSVRNNGTATCQQTSLGTPVDIVFTNTDTTAFTVPSLSQDNVALPADMGLVVSTTVRLELPLEAVTDLGSTVDGVSNLNWRNTYTNVIATDIAGNPNQGEDPSNNTRAGNTNVRSSGTFDKLFSGVTGEAGNTLTTAEGAQPSGYSAYQFEGPPGSSTAHDGNTVVLPGQTVLSNLYSTQNIPVNTGTQFSSSKVVCDVWDDTKLGLPATFTYAGSTNTVVQIPSNGSPVWVSGYHHNNSTYNADTSALPNLTIQYSSTPTPGDGAESDCSTGTWHDSAAAVPGATLVDGLWQGVNRVRVSFSTSASNTDQQVEVNTSVALTVRADAGAQGTILPNWASIIESEGVKDRDAVLADPGATKSLSSYAAETNNGGLGDRLIVGQAVARIKKFVKNLDTGDYTDSAVPQYTAGSNIDYRLNPSLTASSSATGSFGDVTVEDCLPRYQSFVSSARASGAPIAPVVTQLGSPAGAGITCAADETYVKWDLGQNEINAPIDPILYTVEVLATVRNGVYTNTTLVTSSGDPSPASARTDTAQVQIVVPTGIKIAKSVDKSTVEATPAGAATPRGFTWTIDFANIDSPQNVSDVDVIDVLPANGVSGTHFTGTLALDAVTPTGTTTGITTLYTADPSAQLQVDPSDPTNGSTGTTVWCDAPANGSVVSGSGTSADCPTSLAQVTGLRFLRAGDFTPNDQLTIDVSMSPSGNSAADVYENRTSGRVVGVTQPVGPAVRAVTVVASSIGDYVWNDLNSNGIQDTGEPGVANVPVALTGTDVDGNAVSATTTTDTNGNYLFADLASGTYVVTFDPAWVAAHNFEFTLEAQGTDRQTDSNANVTTGATGDIALGVDENRVDIDAGLVQLLGGLVIVKDLTGVGVANAAGPFEFSVECTYLDQGVYSGTVSLERTGDDTTLRGDRIGGIPVGASCVVTETDSGGADTTPAPVTVVIVTNSDDNTVIVGIVNEFSAGTISVAKILDGTAATDPTVTAKTFTILVTCQIAVDGEADPVTLFSGNLFIKGGQNLTLVDGNDDPVLLPLGTVCFGVETDDGGAAKAVVDHDSFENGVVVTSGTPETLQTLQLTATNTFNLTPPTPTPPTSSPVADGGPTVLGNTGLAIGGTITMIGLLIAGGLALLLIRRRRSTEQQ
jgi:hypothetical protein